jgi:hypothetical protein
MTPHRLDALMWGLAELQIGGQQKRGRCRISRILTSKEVTLGLLAPILIRIRYPRYISKLERDVINN